MSGIRTFNHPVLHQVKMAEDAQYYATPASVNGERASRRRGHLRSRFSTGRSRKRPITLPTLKFLSGEGE